MLQKFKFLVLTLMMGASLQAAAQKGTISGHVADKITGEDVIGASVFLEGTTIGAATDINGNFQFSADAGTHNLVVTYVGYKKLVTAVTVTASQDVKVTLTLESDDQHLEEVVVKAQADKTSESVLLMDRKKSIDIVQGIGAIELSRKGVSDAEGAVTQITGVTKQQGSKNVFVRGLADRYNSTTLNGLPLPSEDPAYKNINLNFFATNIISNVEVNKTFSSKIAGDVGGANINIISKELFEDREFSVSASMGVNSQVSGADFYRADGNNFLGTVDKDIPITNLNRYDFKNSFKPTQLNGPLLNSNFSVSGGKNFTVGDNQLKVFAVGALTSDYFFIKKGEANQPNEVGGPRQLLNYDRSEYQASQFALGSAKYIFGNSNYISYNTLYIHDNKQSVVNYRGYSISGVDDISAPNAFDNLIRRQQTNNNVLLVNQLISELNITDRLALDIRTSFNIVRGDEPDRRQNAWIGDGNGESYVPNTNSPAYNHRFFSTLKENEMAAIVSGTYKINEEKTKLTAGYSFRNTARDFDYVQFNFDTQNSSVEVDPSNPDAYYNQNGIDNDVFDLETSRGTDGSALKPFFYTGDRQIHAGFVNFVHEFSTKLSINAGVRVDAVTQKVVWSTGADIIRPGIPGDNTVDRDNLYVLPSLNAKYSFTENDQLRFASSMSYTYPQFKEVAPFLYEDPRANVFGNIALKPSRNLNFDLKYEHYFMQNGLIAVTGFYKHIENAINMVQANSAALEYSYVNTGDADVMGAEVELKKDLINFSRKANGQSLLSAGANISYLYATQTLRNSSPEGVQFTPNGNSTGLEGASPWLIAADLTYTNANDRGRKLTSSVILNYFSTRIGSLGFSTIENVNERRVPTLDFVNRFELNRHFTVNLSIKNILNPVYKLDREVLSTGDFDTISSYRRGVTSSIGLSYKL